jgi:hypothetical protein
MRLPGSGFWTDLAEVVGDARDCLPKVPIRHRDALGAGKHCWHSKIDRVLIKGKRN